MLTLAGVNDANLLELSRLFGVKVSLRGDAMVITGAGDFVQRAVAVGRRMVELAPGAGHDYFLSAVNFDETKDYVRKVMNSYERYGEIDGEESAGGRPGRELP